MIRNKFANTYIDNISMNDVITLIDYNIQKKVKTHIVFLNSFKMYKIDRNDKLKKAMHEAELILADGVPILWCSRLFGFKLPSRVNGTDLFENLLKWANENRKSVFLLGSKQEYLRKLLEILNEMYPNLKLNFRNGYFDDSDDQEVLDMINNSNADILFLGFSSPKKEIWANKYKDKIKTPIIQGVGGSFDVLANIVPRAPIWMQKVGLEWLYRTLKEPKRMMIRYLKANSYFVFIVIKYYFINKANQILSRYN